MHGTSLSVKYIFLSFLQQYFRDNTAVEKYKWDRDPRNTKILIADKYAIDTGIVAKRPSIILSREPYGWSYSTRNPGTPPPKFFKERNVPFGSADGKNNRQFTDLLQGGITLSVMTKEGVQAEEIADHVFYALSGYRDKLKKKGVYKLRGLRVSGERILKQSSNIEVSLVAISFQYMIQKTVNLSSQQYNFRAFIDDEEVIEGHQFKILPDGNSVEFMVAPEEDSTIVFNFIDAITLDQRSGVNPVEPADGDRTIFTIPNGWTIYGYYKLLENIIINKVDEENSEEWVNMD